MSASVNTSKYTFEVTDLTKLVPGQMYFVKSTNFLFDPGLVKFKELKADGMIVFENPNSLSVIYATRSFDATLSDIPKIERNPKYLKIYSDTNPNASAGGRRRRRTRRTRRSRHTRRTHRK